MTSERPTEVEETGQPLSGIRVLDLTIWQQGPMTTAMLADWGADVIKIEGPDSPDPGRSLIRYDASPGGPNAYFETHNRNKRGLVLDLKLEAGREVFYRLVKDADVVIQNFRPGVGDKLGIGYERLRELNPRLVYCQASGFGLKGPDAQRPALDPLAQARGGVMSVTGEPETPPTRTFPGFADQVSAFLLSFGVMVALFHRERTGQGQMVDGSLLQSVIASQAFNITSFMMSNTYAGSPIPRISRKMTSPLWNHYRAGDGRWIMLGMTQIGRYWPGLRQAMADATGETLEPPEMSVEWIRMNAGDLVGLIARLDEMFAKQPAAYWVEHLRKYDLLIEAVQEYGDLLDDSQVTANDMFTTLDHAQHGPLPIVAPAVNLSETPGRIRTAAPEFGQHSEEVLLEAGYSWEEIEALRSDGVIGHR
ncbi:MAG: CoA transferase [Chloroflexi bacterium]|nr:CoA transferase [Chloroflexota bacterium]MCI0818059.1 CoA transferase [Chloroflexota bacterium]MCI0819552.1 CoA transferase [Chloroflexota bacterium]MCI0831897.1 CoA transferase [Chloroflexota bacterium]MCI0838915.1 CoA transferase [Chloroflexota bacterium]